MSEYATRYVQLSVTSLTVYQEVFTFTVQILGIVLTGGVTGTGVQFVDEDNTEVWAMNVGANTSVVQSVPFFPEFNTLKVILKTTGVAKTDATVTLFYRESY